MKRAKEQGLVDDYRRPKLHLGESDVDFVGSNISYELKAVTQQVLSRLRERYCKQYSRFSGKYES